MLLDGSLCAPTHFIDQRTIIRGDETEPIISLASIVAKVTRDRRMEKLGASYPAWGFEEHKGYGTIEHRRTIARLGLSSEHRLSFCSGLRIGPKRVLERIAP